MRLPSMMAKVLVTSAMRPSLSCTTSPSERYSVMCPFSRTWPTIKISGGSLVCGRGEGIFGEVGVGVDGWGAWGNGEGLYPELGHYQ